MCAVKWWCEQYSADNPDEEKNSIDVEDNHKLLSWRWNADRNFSLSQKKNNFFWKLLLLLFCKRNKERKYFSDYLILTYNY